MKQRVARVGATVAVALALAGGPLVAQAQWERGGDGWCDERWGGGDRERFCEVLTASVDAPSRLAIDAGTNGGIEVVGWSQRGMEVEARVWAQAGSEARAREIAREVRIRTEGGRLSADGPSTGRREHWSVSFRVRVPRGTDLDLETHNGGIGVDGVAGTIRFAAVNGGVHLTGVAGDVRGRTTNGGLHIELDGSRWDGAGLDAETTNGGVRVTLPSDYSAELVTGTVNGGIDIDFPVTVQGRIGRRLATTLGSGGPTIRAITTNGGVKIERR